MFKQAAGFSLAAILAGASLGVMAAPVTYQSDPDHTFANISYEHLGFTHQQQRFKASGVVVLDLEAKTGSVDFTVDMTSVSTGHEGFDQRIQTEDFLDTAQYPTATFKSTHIKFDGDRPVAAEGDITIKGVTKPITLTLTSFAAKPHPTLKKPAVGGDVTGTIKRTEFNAGKFVPLIADEVTLNLVVEALQKE